MLEYNIWTTFILGAVANIDDLFLKFSSFLPQSPTREGIP